MFYVSNIFISIDLNNFIGELAFADKVHKPMTALHLSKLYKVCFTSRDDSVAHIVRGRAHSVGQHKLN